MVHILYMVLIFVFISNEVFWLANSNAIMLLFNEHQLVAGRLEDVGRLALCRF